MLCFVSVCFRMLSPTRELRPSPSFPLPGCLALEVKLREWCLVGRRVISLSCVSPPVEDIPKEAFHTLMEPALKCLKQNTLKVILTYIIGSVPHSFTCLGYVVWGVRFGVPGLVIGWGLRLRIRVLGGWMGNWGGRRVVVWRGR